MGYKGIGEHTLYLIPYTLSSPSHLPYSHYSSYFRANKFYLTEDFHEFVC
jgi:hypothetical protein